MTSSGSGSITSSIAGIDEERSPLWKYVSNIEKGVNVGGNRKWTCNYCGKNYAGSYTRVRAHLLKISGKGVAACKNVTVEDVIEMKKVDEETEKRLDSLKSKTIILPSSTSLPPSEFSQAFSQFTSKKRKGDSSIEKAFDMENRDQLDAEIARMFYTSGLPFNLARNPHFVQSYSFAANTNLSGYVPPTYNKLRTTLLLQEKTHVETLLEPIKSKWDKKGVTIVSNGWSDPQRRPVIDFMVVSDGCPMFIKSVDCSGIVKDKHFIAAKLEEVINEIGDNKIVQVITDNVANCKAAGEIIEGKFPGIYWTPCVVHTLNLALKDICAAKNVDSNQEVYHECGWITEVHDDALFVKKFVMNHKMRLAIFNRFSALKLLAVADTRFASIVVMLKRFKLIRCFLENVVLSDEWKNYKEDDRRDAETIRDLVANDGWWRKISYIIDFTSPIYDMLRACDTVKPCLHLVYEMWDSMIEKVKKVIYEHEGLLANEESSFYDVIHGILVARWAKNNTPLHCLAHSLNPRFYSKKWLQEGDGRVPPHMDYEVASERNKCFKRIFRSEDYKAAITEYALFAISEGHFNDCEAIDAMSYMEPRSWWVVYGSATPLVQTLALKVLGQPSSSSCCERNWSTCSFFQSLRRNKLTPKCAEHLVFVHNNLRLLSHSYLEHQTEKTKMWDVGGDDLGSMEDVGFLEIDNLTLDEPELENAFYEEAEDNVEE